MQVIVLSNTPGKSRNKAGETLLCVIPNTERISAKHIVPLQLPFSHPEIQSVWNIPTPKLNFQVKKIGTIIWVRIMETVTEITDEISKILKLVKKNNFPLEERDTHLLELSQDLNFPRPNWN